MSSGIYHRRWANATSTDGRNSATVRHSENVTQAIEPHTYGTSWNSVRWNKPLENGGRTGGGGYCSRSMPFFESISKDYEAKPAYALSPSRRFGSQLASKNNTELKNSGPYGRERSVCFGGAALSLINDKASNRTSRLSWLSDNCSLASRRNNFFSKATRNSRENNAFTANSKCMPAAPSATRSFPSEVRKATPASSSSSSVSKLLHDKLLLGDKAQVISGSSINGSAAVKTDRPWRRRMADAARLRDAHGDEIGGAVNSTLMAIRARRSNVPNGRSATNNSGNELRTSLNALKNYIDEQTTNFHRQNNRFAARDTDKLSLDNSLKQHTPSWVLSSTRWNSGRVAGHMSRSYSPVRPRPSACNNMKLSKYNSVSTDMLLGPLRPSRQASANDACKNDKSYVLGQVIHNSPVPETVCERESVGRLLSSKERTLRHQLRLHKLGVESNSSSSDIEQQQTEERKWKPRKRLRKKSNSESKSESKQLLTGAEEAMTDSISVGMDIRKESAAAEVEEMERNQIFHSSQTSCSITFPVVCTGRSELTVRSDQELKKIDKERKDGVIKKGLQLIVKKKKKEKRNLREKCDRATSSTDREKEVTRGIVGQSSDNKCMECNEMSRGMPKMLKNDVELMDGGERRCSDRRLSASLLSPITLNSARRNTAMSTSIDNHFEANGKPHDGAAQFDSSGKMRHSKSKSPAPVPGTWSGPDYREINISHNKRLHRYEKCKNEEVLGVIVIKFISYTVPAVTVRETKLNYHRSVQITINCTFHPPVANSEDAYFNQKYFKRIKVDKKLSAVINATIEFDTSLTARRGSVMEGIAGTIKMKKKRIACSTVVEEPVTRVIAFRELIRKRSDGQNSCRAQVTVLTSPLADVNFYRCLKRVQVAHPKHYPISMENIATKQAYAVEENSAVLSASDDGDSEIILSERSLLQKYVNYKRGKWKRMHSEPVELSSRESLSPLPVSELRRACAVRILEPTRQMPYITAPSRSRLGSVEVDTVSTAVRTCGEQLLSTNYYGVKHSATNTSDRPMSLTKPSFEFDTAMSPLEQILQNQAFKLRKIPTSSDSNILAVQDSSVVDAAMQLPIRSYSRHPSVEGSSLASNFTAAIAAAATHQPHERYAAHISVTRFNGSGRQSAANINPHNSGSSETKTLQLNQMIDHIRCRRNQHRNKFKEAIAYLDQIFEDLKKEGDQVDSMQRSRGIRTESRRKGVSKSGADLMTATVSQSMELQKHNGNTEQSMAANVIGEEKLDAQEVPANRHSLYASKPKITEKHCLQEKASSFERTSDDMDISERDVQPLQSRKLKGERMNFTRRWLTGDVKPWTAVQPKPDLILGGVEEEPEIDERSIGSCSAEVAAINAVVRKKKKARDVPDIIQNVASKAKYARQSNAHQIDRCTRKCGGGGSGHNVQKTDPIKPLPVKAHPTTFNFSTGSTGNLNNFNNLSQSLHYSNAWSSNYDISSNQTSSQRILSQNRISDQVHHGSDADAISWRSPPHHSRYNTLSSPRSDEVQPSMRKTGAFTPVQPPNAITIRGSVASLPDSSTIRPQPLHGVDPFVTIDALVAELELNTDQASIASKRRSFPTGNEFFAHYGGYHEKPNSRKTVNSSQQMEQSNICPSANTKCVDRKQQQKQPQKLNDSFNEMANMLESVISDVTAPNELCKGRKYAQTGMKNKSILSPFETINQEKLNPSKVEAMQSIFENKKYTPVWRRKTSNDSSDNVQSIQSNVNDDDNYYEINDLVVLQKEFIPAPVKQSGKQSASPNSRLKRRLPSVATTAAAVPSRPEFIPAFPVTHPPPHPPAGSTNSSQTGGYYSSGSSLGAQSSYASRNNHLSIPSNSICNRGMVTLTKQPLSSEAANFEEEDDGFYDNIRTDDKRFSRGSELDNVSTVSTTINKPPGPVKTSSRIGQFLRKISASKPPISAASLISLNKFTSEMMPTIPIPLMKSSSLSHCKEKKSVQNINHISSAMIDKRDGLGQRLKNSIFGSKKHL